MAYLELLFVMNTPQTHQICFWVKPKTQKRNESHRYGQLILNITYMLYWEKCAGSSLRAKMAVELSGSLNHIKTTNFILKRTEVMRFQNCHFNANMNATLGMIPLILTDLTIVASSPMSAWFAGNKTAMSSMMCRDLILR
jgi:hypothetical protein